MRAARGRDSLAAVVDGDTRPEPDGATAPGGDAPEAVAELAGACVRFVERALGIRLDYTPETLPVLDHWLRGGEARGRQEVLALVAPAAGAYFGEVVRRSLGDGRWHAPADDHASWRLEMTRSFLCFNPLGAALECALDGPAPGWRAHLVTLPADERELAALLDRTAHVREEDFYRLAVRWEVLEQAVGFLRTRAEAAAARAGAEGAPTFGPELYAALLAGGGAGSGTPAQS